MDLVGDSGHVESEIQFGPIFYLSGTPWTSSPRGEVDGPPLGESPNSRIDNSVLHLRGQVGRVFWSCLDETLTGPYVRLWTPYRTGECPLKSFPKGDRLVGKRKTTVIFRGRDKKEEA